MSNESTRYPGVAMASQLSKPVNGGRKRGQTLTEFAVALPFLLVILLGLFEAARWFQAYLAVQYAAREASRFAVTGQPPMLITDGDGSCQENGIPVTGAPYNLPTDYQQCRVDYIKEVGFNLAKLGVIVDHTVTDVTQPRFLGVYVRGSPSYGAVPVSDHAGVARGRVEIRVVYNHPVTNPFMAALIPTIRVIGTTEMINEPWIGGGPEVPAEFEPPDPLPSLDSDGDGWSDVDERDIHGTLPGNADTDGDGAPEGPGGDPAPLDPCIPTACEDGGP
jgi:hypothetical protein